MLGACRHTKTAGVALIGVYCVCLPIAVHPCLDTRWKAQCCAILITQRSQLKDVVRADTDAVLFALTSIPINDRREHARILLHSSMPVDAICLAPILF